MKYELIIKPEAELDLLNASMWYEEKQQRLGMQFLDQVDEKFRHIIQNPNKYQIRYKNIRFALIDRFPYAIHFLIEKKTILVLAVLGTRENPEKW